MKVNFAERRLLLGRFSESPNKDSFNEGSKLELNHLNTLSMNDFVTWQLMKLHEPHNLPSCQTINKLIILILVIKMVINVAACVY